MKRKYEDVKGYWIYSIKIPSVNKYYIGVSKRQCCQRWNKSLYKGMALEPYLSEWDSMIKTVLVDNLTKEEAYQYEDNIIRALQMNDLCINTNRSGLITNDINTYQKEYRKENKEKLNENQKEWYENNQEYRKQYLKQYHKQWQKDNPEYHKQWREDNREQYNEYQREYRLKKKLEKQQQQTSLF